MRCHENTHIVDTHLADVHFAEGSCYIPMLPYPFEYLDIDALIRVSIEVAIARSGQMMYIINGGVLPAASLPRLNFISFATMVHS